MMDILASYVTTVDLYAILNDYGNDIEINDATKGLILRSPGGSRYRLSVDDAGVISTTLL